jgi:hypothetical protein
MNAWCLECLTAYSVRSTRGSSIGGLRCDCGRELVGASNGIAATASAARDGDRAAHAAIAAAKRGEREPARLFGLLRSVYPGCWGRFLQALRDRDFDHDHHLRERCDQPLDLLLLLWAERGPRTRPTHATVVRMEATCHQHALVGMQQLHANPRAGAGRVVAVIAWPMPAAALPRIYRQPVTTSTLFDGPPVAGSTATAPAPLWRSLPPPVALKLQRTPNPDVLQVELDGRRYELHTLRDGLNRRVWSYAVLDVTDSGPNTSWREQLRAEGTRADCRAWLEAVARGEDPP